MATTMQHKDGYIAEIEYDEELDLFHGLVTNTSDIITFYGKSVAELKREFDHSIQEHINYCKKRGLAPSKPYSGRMTVRISPALHSAISAMAIRARKSLNTWIIDSLKHELNHNH